MFSTSFVDGSDYFKEVTFRKFFFYGCLCGKATGLKESEYLYVSRKEWNKTLRFVINE